MNNFLSYLTEASIAITAFYAGYYFILRHKAAADFNRCYLLASLFLAMSIPFIHIPLSTAETGTVPIIWEPASQAWNFLPELVIYGQGPSTEAAAADIQISWVFWGSCLYLAGVVSCLLLTGFRLFRLHKLIKRYSFRYSGDYSYQLAPTNGEHPTFSFLHYIFWDNTAPLSKDEEKQVLQHEIAHVKQRHSLDLLFLELVSALLWFNPLVYLFRQSLLQVHEFQADQYALQQGEPDGYLRLMVKQTLRQANIPLVSTFFQHNTLTRIRMIQSRPTHPVLRATFSILLAGSIFFIAACEDEAEKLEEKPQLMELSAEEGDDIASGITVYVSRIKDLKNQQLFTPEDKVIRFSSGEFIYTIRDIKNQETYEKIITSLRNHKPETFHRDNQKLIHLLTEASGGPVKHVSATSTEDFPSTFGIPEEELDADQVFEVVEDQPVPVGGMEAFYKFVGQRLQYPEEARENGIEGKVFIQFVVDEKGDVSNVKAVKGLGYGLDKAAEDMIRETKWESGKQKDRPVKVRMIMPVMFKLAAE